MSGLLRRLIRRGPATADENRSPAIESSEPAAAPADTPAEPGGQSPTSVWSGQARAAEAGESPSAPVETGQTTAGDQPTAVLPATGEQPLPAWTVAATQPTAFAAQPAPPRDLPAGVDPGDLAAGPAVSARRGKLRRRLRYLRHVRQLLLRDLGGFTYEVHRTAGTAQESHRRLTAAKAERISKLDEEVRALESRLGEPHAEAVLREPGIGGTCRECGELHASDAHFCARCGAPLDAEARALRPAAAPVSESHTVAEPQPASVLWAGGPRPVPEPAAEEQEAPQPPSEVTSQWLATDRPTTFSRAAQPDQPAQADEPAATAEPAKADEPAATAEPAQADEPAAADEPPKIDEPAETAEPATTDQPDATADEPAQADEPAKADPPALDEPATAVDVPDADEPAKPKRVAKPRKRAPAKPGPKQAPEPPRFGNNGHGDDDVPPPVGDPFATRREEGS